MSPDLIRNDTLVDGVDAAIVGYYYYEFPNITINAQVVGLNEGSSFSTTVKVPLTDLIGRGKLTSAEIKRLESINVLPHNVSKSQKNIDQIMNRTRLSDIGIQAWIAEGRTHFKEGEKVRLKVVTDSEAHIAVFDHFVDGKSIVLFPNQYEDDTLTRKDEIKMIPLSENSRYKIAIREPFGSDIIQIIACSSNSELQAVIKYREAISGSPFDGIPRGMVIEELTSRGLGLEAVDGSEADGSSISERIRWGEAYIVLHTYPGL